MEVIPAILAKTKEEFLEKLRLVESLVSTVQIDCMDGRFVTERTWHKAEPLETALLIELHLMVSDPLSVIEDWHDPLLISPFKGGKTEGVLKRALWHLEIPVDHEDLIVRCRALGLECGLALSPATPVAELVPYLDKIDEVLILGVEPGKSGQKLLPQTLAKIAEVKKLNPKINAGFDGGVNLENMREVVASGADRLNLASAIFGAVDPQARLRDILKTI